MDPKSQTRDRVDQELASKIQLDTRSRADNLVLACRMLGERGHWHGGLAGQITARGEQAGTYWTLKFGIGADEATAADLILVDDDLRPLDGVSMANPAVRFHLWVYRVRPDVQSIVHTHPPGVTALSMTGQRLSVAHMDATPFHDNCGYLGDWPGLPIADNEGEIIAGALGHRKALLLAHHGLLTAGATIQEAAVLAIWLEQAAQAQVQAAAIGAIREVRPELALEARDFLLKPQITGLTFQYFARKVLRDDPGCLARTQSPLTT
ncbi:aldolase [Ramlibacter sp.]|uniref:aldolase n=1 Tax=Ramlibacter sp. TaxID=1917967 RepID=UPI002FCB83A4